MKKVTLWAENERLRAMVHGLRRQLESAQARLAERQEAAVSGSQTAWKAQRREWDEDYAELERQLAEARSEVSRLREADHPRTYSLVGSPHLFLVTDDESGINLGYADRIGGPLVQAPTASPGREQEAYATGRRDEAVDALDRQDAALAERDARLQREIDRLRTEDPSDSSGPGWYWDGWHAALDAVSAVLAEEPKP